MSWGITGKIESRIIVDCEPYSDDIVAVGDDRCASINFGWDDIRIRDIKTNQIACALVGHMHSITCLIVLNEQQLASGSQDKTIKIWDIKTGDCLKTFVGHSDPVSCIAKISPTRIASGSLDGTIRIWHLVSGNCLMTLSGHPDSYMTSLVRISDTCIASSTSDKNIRIWDIASGTCIRKLKGHMAAIFSLALLSEKLLVSSSWDRTVKIWDAQTGHCLKTIYVEHPNMVRRIIPLNDRTLVCFVDDGDIISRYTSKDRLRILNIQTGEWKTLIGHSGWTWGLSKRPDGSLLSAGQDSSIRLWNFEEQGTVPQLKSTAHAKNFAEEAKRHLDTPENFCCPITLLIMKDPVCDPEGHSYERAAIMRQIETRGISPLTRQPLDKVYLNPNRALKSEIEKYKTEKVTACVQLAKQCIAVDDLETANRLIDRIEELVPGQPDVEVLRDAIEKRTHDEAELIADMIKLTCRPSSSFEKGKSIHSRVIVHNELFVPLVQPLSNKKFVCLGLFRIQIWDIETGTCIKTIEDQSERISCPCLLTENLVACGLKDGSIKIWDLQRGQALKTITGHSGEVGCLAKISNTCLVSGSLDCTIKVWDTIRLECLMTLSGHDQSVTTLAKISEHHIVSGSLDCTIRIWDIASGKCLNKLEGHHGVVECVAVLSENFLASGSRDGTIKIWNMQTGQCLKTLKTEKVVTGLLVLDETTLASYSIREAIIKIWDIQTGRWFSTLWGHHSEGECRAYKDGVTSLSKLPDGSLLSAGLDSTFRIWTVK